MEEMTRLQEYFEGVLWNVQMYRNARCPDNTWQYESKHGPDSKYGKNEIILACPIAVRHSSSFYKPLISSAVSLWSPLELRCPSSKNDTLLPHICSLAMLPRAGIIVEPWKLFAKWCSCSKLLFGTLQSQAEM